MIIEKTESGHYVARQGGREFLGYSSYEAACRAIDHVFKYRKPEAWTMRGAIARIKRVIEF